MIPLSIRQLYSNQINWMYKIGASPFYWNTERSRLQVSSDIRKWKVSLIATIVYLSYIVFRLIQTSSWNISSTDYNLLVVMFALTAFMHAFQLLLFLRNIDFGVIINSSLKFYSKFEDNFRKRGTKAEPKSIGFMLAKSFMTLLIPVLKTAALSWGLIAACLPYELMAPTSLFHDEYKANSYFGVFLRPTYGCFIFWFGLTIGGPMIVTCSSVVLIAIGYILCEDELKVGKKGPYWTKGWLRTPMNLRKTMDSLSILVRLFHNAAQDFVMIVQMMMTRIVHLCCFLLIRHYHDMKKAHTLIISGMMILFMISVLGFMQGSALFHTSSTKIVRSWKKCAVISQRERIIWNKIRKSIKPLGIKVGNCFVVKPITVVSFAENYFKGTIRFLLTFKKKAVVSHVSLD